MAKRAITHLATLGATFAGKRMIDNFFSENNELLPEIKAVMETATFSPEDTEVETHLSDLDKVVNVTVPLQCLVEAPSRLVLYSGKKSGLAGFYDPCPNQNEEKQLLIRYLYQGKVHYVQVEETSQLRIPRISHQL